MIKTLSLLLSVSVVLTVVTAGESNPRLHFPNARFSIAPLDAVPGEVAQHPLMMFLPATEAFAANVKVQIQPYAGSIDEYTALSVQQFQSLGMKLLHQKNPAKSVVTFEYTGENQGRPLYWYSRAEKSGKSVYLVTATATAGQWVKEGDRLKACVDSFRCEPAEAGQTVRPAAPTR